MEKFVEKMEKAMEEREETPKVPSTDAPCGGGLGQMVAGERAQLQREQQPPNISEMKPLTREAYGGGMYAGEGEQRRREPGRPRASVTQSADGPEEQQPAGRPGHPPPPSTGDRDLDITGQSYIQ
ncbi:hypothetical protein ACP70R_002091 [Stipagrostis hirtigluma subsp. patula]